MTGNTPPGSPATVSTPYTMTYDDAGNMTSDGKDYNYTYDVFGRLVGIGTTGDSPVKGYRYNGLGWRITDSDGTDTEHLVYNERWQLVATYDGADVREQFVHHAAGLDGRGGSSYIDSVILRTTYTGTGQNVAEDKRFYYAQNWRADVSVVLDDAGIQQERVIYSPYGQPFAMPAGDTNFDGDHEAGVDGDELADWENNYSYHAYADVNLDGDIDGADATAASEHDLGWNVLTSGGGGASGVNNRLGYAGYIHDRDVATAAHVRHRVYKIDLGRWVQRDPLNYIDGASLVSYVRGAPIAMLDPNGLFAERALSFPDSAGGACTDFGGGCGGGESFTTADPGCVATDSCGCDGIGCQKITTWRCGTNYPIDVEVTGNCGGDPGVIKAEFEKGNLCPTFKRILSDRVGLDKCFKLYRGTSRPMRIREVTGCGCSGEALWPEHTEEGIGVEPVNVSFCFTLGWMPPCCVTIKGTVTYKWVATAHMCLPTWIG